MIKLLSFSKMGKLKLDLDIEDDDNSFKINKKYAENYEKWRSTEVFQQLKDKYKGKIPVDDGEQDEDSPSESEPEWTADDDKSFFRALGALKANDPKIYDKNAHFFKEKVSDDNKTKKQKQNGSKNGMTLRDYEVALVTEKEGEFDEEDAKKNIESEGYHEKTARLKAAFKDVMDSDSEDDGFLQKRVKTSAEQDKEEEDYFEWLKGEGKNFKIDPNDDMNKLKVQWSQALTDDEKFLRDYLLDKKYQVDDVIDDEEEEYDEMIEIEKQFDECDNFEQKYNFRFEESDRDFIKQYPRTVKESIRQEPGKRKQQREEREKRKEEEKRQQKEEIKLLKSLKKKEIEEKLKKLREIAGDDSLPITIEDLEKEFDPNEYDEKMKKIFAENYYKGVEEEEKPVFSDLTDDDEEPSDYDTMPIGSIASNDDQEDKERDEEEKMSRKRKRRSKFQEVIEKKKPVFDPKQNSFEDYLNEYYALDYEDILPGNIKTKFKYRHVPANNFGLSTEEVLSLDDKQLNQWVSVKKTSQCRSQQEEEKEKKFYERKAQNPNVKAKIFARKRFDDDSRIKSTPGNKKPTFKKKSQRKETKHDQPTVDEVSATGKKKNRRKAKGDKSRKSKINETGVDLDRLKAYNISNRTIKKKVFGKKHRKSE